MNRNLKIGLNVVVWAAMAVYLVLAAGYCSRQKSDQLCTGLNIMVKDSSKLGFVTEESVRQILVGERMKLTGARLDSISLLAVEEAVVSRPYIKTARVYRSMDGKINIEVQQRTPVARVQTENGYHFYISDDNYIMPIRSSAFIDVPIVSGVPEFPFGTEFAGVIPEQETPEKKSDEKMRFLYNLINFVTFLQRDPFWSGQIVQINVTKGNEVELIPRVGRGVILLGDPDRFQEKLEKLYTFYRRGLAYEGWNKYAYINLTVRGQVICTP